MSVNTISMEKLSCFTVGFFAFFFLTKSNIILGYIYALKLYFVGISITMYLHKFILRPLNNK